MAHSLLFLLASSAASELGEWRGFRSMGAPHCQSAFDITVGESAVGQGYSRAGMQYERKAVGREAVGAVMQYEREAVVEGGSRGGRQ
jgi:hypothetical protein